MSTCLDASVMQPGNHDALLIDCLGLQKEWQRITSSRSRPLRHMLMCGSGVQLPMMSAADLRRELITVACVSELCSTGDPACKASGHACAIVSE